LVSIPIISDLKSKKGPMHIAVNTEGIKNWSEENKKELIQAVNKHLELLDELVDMQIKNETQVLTINLSEHEGMIDNLNEFFKHLINDERIHKNKIRVFIIGQWYELDSELRETFKELMEKTKDYNQYFLNFCIRYDGQEELLGAIRLIVRKILSEKMKEEELTSQVIKENLYSSYFPPPQLIIEPGMKYSGIMLWDSKGALIYFTRQPWLDFDKKEFDKAISFYLKEADKVE